MASDVLNRMSTDVIASAISFPAQSECNVVRPDLGVLTRKVTKRESFRKMRIGALTFLGFLLSSLFWGLPHSLCPQPIPRPLGLEKSADVRRAKSRRCSPFWKRDKTEADGFSHPCVKSTWRSTESTEARAPVLIWSPGLEYFLSVCSATLRFRYRYRTGASGLRALVPAFPGYRWTELHVRFQPVRHSTGVAQSFSGRRPGTYFSGLAKLSLFRRLPFNSSSRNHTPQEAEHQMITALVGRNLRVGRGSLQGITLADGHSQ